MTECVKFQVDHSTDIRLYFCQFERNYAYLTLLFISTRKVISIWERGEKTKQTKQNKQQQQK